MNHRVRPALGPVPATPLLLLLVVVLAGCAGQPRENTDQDARHAAWADRSARLGDLENWGFTSRLSIDDGADGGSGRLDWRTRPSSSSLQFRGALGQGAWRLAMDPDGATLSLADGSVYQGASVNELVQRETNWRIPVDALSWWVRGLAFGDPELLELDPEGRPLLLREAGWTIEYERFDDFNGLHLPIRLQAFDGQVRVKLAISRWSHASAENQEGTDGG